MMGQDARNRIASTEGRVLEFPQPLGAEPFQCSDCDEVTRVDELFNGQCEHCSLEAAAADWADQQNDDAKLRFD